MPLLGNHAMIDARLVRFHLDAVLPPLAVQVLEAHPGHELRHTTSPGLSRRFVGGNRVASRATLLYLATCTRNRATRVHAYSYRAAVCLHAAHIAALRGFWTDWLTHGNTVLTTNVHGAKRRI